MADLMTGTTRQVHVEQLLKEVDATIDVIRVGIASRLTTSQRDALSRQLAGVIGSCESIRIWLAAGAPR